MTLSPENINETFSAIINLINLNYTNIMVNCIYEKGWNYNHAKILYNELNKIADYLIENNLYNKVFIRFFDEDLYNPIGEEDNNNWCGGTTNKNLALDYKGNYYPCIRYMESSLNDK
jgi:sulfatase maturation enzyme AslB (radical SAM superfamily)